MALITCVDWVWLILCAGLKACIPVPIGMLTPEFIVLNVVLIVYTPADWKIVCVCGKFCGSLGDISVVRSLDERLAGTAPCVDTGR